MTDELRIHWSLHEIDEEAVPYEAARAKFPEQRRALEVRVAGEKRRLEALDAKAADLVKRRRALEAEIAALETQEKRFRAQLDAVTDQKQFEAVQHQVAGVAGKRSDLETEALSLMDGEESAAAERPKLADALARAEHDAAETLAKIDAEDARLAALLAALDARRTAASAPLDAATRSRYERARAARGGRAVAAILENKTCGACFRAVPPTALQEARRAERLLPCEGCGRMLMLPPGGTEG